MRPEEKSDEKTKSEEKLEEVSLRERDGGKIWEGIGGKKEGRKEGRRREGNEAIVKEEWKWEREWKTPR